MLDRDQISSWSRFCALLAALFLAAGPAAHGVFRDDLAFIGCQGTLDPSAGMTWSKEIKVDLSAPMRVPPTVEHPFAVKQGVYQWTTKQAYPVGLYGHAGWVREYVRFVSEGTGLLPEPLANSMGRYLTAQDYGAANGFVSYEFNGSALTIDGDKSLMRLFLAKFEDEVRTVVSQITCSSFPERMAMFFDLSDPKSQREFNQFLRGR